MHRFKLLFKMVEYVRLVVELEDNNQDDHVNGEEQQDDKNKFENNLRAQSHLGPFCGHQLPALCRTLLLYSLLFRLRGSVTGGQRV